MRRALLSISLSLAALTARGSSSARPMRRALLCMSLSLAALAGCGGPPSEVKVTLGGVTADGRTFAPLDGDQPLVPGSQGGFHVWVKLRFEGVQPGRVTLERTARRVRDDRLVLTTRTAVEVGEWDEGGAFELADPIPSFMCPTPIGVGVIDEQIRFEINTLDADGNVLAHDEAVATPRCPEGEQSQFCQNICSG